MGRGRAHGKLESLDLAAYPFGDCSDARCRGVSSAYGHVAVAEKLLNSTTVESTTMNWYANGDGFNIESTWDFMTANGAYFVWHP
jgi:surface antigen